MYTIGKLATLAGVSPDTLRYYEKESLITPTDPLVCCAPLIQVAASFH